LTDRARLKKKLDTIHSKLIRSIEKSCVVCGSQEMLQCGHLFTRAALSTRWDIEPDGNCHSQCASCNYRHEHDSYPYNNWYIEEFSKDKWDELHRRHKACRKFTLLEMEEMCQEFKNLLTQSE